MAKTGPDTKERILETSRKEFLEKGYEDAWLEENCKSREVYLPDGEWVDFFDGTVYSGGRKITAGTADRLPVFTRNGFTL